MAEYFYIIENFKKMCGEMKRKVKNGGCPNECPMNGSNISQCRKFLIDKPGEAESIIRKWVWNNLMEAKLTDGEKRIISNAKASMEKDCQRINEHRLKRLEADIEELKAVEALLANVESIPKPNYIKQEPTRCRDGNNLFPIRFI